MVAALVLAALTRGDLPDNVLVLGFPFASDQKVIALDCETWKTTWATAGVPNNHVAINSDIHSSAKLLQILANFRKAIQGSKGKVMICISGHGTVKNHLPHINIETMPGHYEAVAWTDVFRQISLPSTWRGEIIPDLCHNNMLGKVLPRNYVALTIDDPETIETCRVTSVDYGKDQVRGVISWAAVRSMKSYPDLETMAKRMSTLCAAEANSINAPKYGFVVRTWSPGR